MKIWTWVLVSLTFWSPAFADRDWYSVMRKADFEARSGCEVTDYNRPISAALRFLVFNDLHIGNPNHDNIQYARRHTKPLFQDLWLNHKEPDGTLDQMCLPHSLLDIALELRLLTPGGWYTNEFAPIDHVYDRYQAPPYRRASEGFVIMTRGHYMKVTGCKVSPTSYDKFRIAFEHVVLGAGLTRHGVEAMTGFLEDLYDSRPRQDGFVSKDCLIEPVARIARELDLLDADERYKSQR